MKTVAVATLAARHAMGQQVYERNLLQALGPRPTNDIRIVDRIVRSLRSQGGGGRRAPLGASHRSAVVSALSARWLYARAELVHRGDLRLPPAPREVVTVHDLAFEHFTDEGRPPATARASLLSARLVVAPSAFSAKELRERWGVPHVRVVPNGIDPALSFARELPAPRSDRYVLHSGGCTERKNLRALRDAWLLVSRQHPDIRLLMTGPPDARRDELFALLPGVELLGHVPLVMQRALLAHAAAVVVPSVYEGFGLPVLEGLAVGTPVVASDMASLPEVAGGHAVLVEPTDEGLAAGLSSVLSSARDEEALTAGARWAARFTWAACADAHVSVYREALLE